MPRFEGTRFLPVPPAVVSAKLADAGFVVGCLDHVEKVVESSPDRAAWKLRHQFRVHEWDARHDAERHRAHRRVGDVPRGQQGDRRFDHSSRHDGVPAGRGGATVTWSAELVERTGLLKLVPAGLVQSAAGSVIEETWKSIETKLHERDMAASSVVLDTNAIVSGLQSARGSSYWILSNLGSDLFEINVTVSLALEYEAICNRLASGFHLASAGLDRFLVLQP